MKKTIAAVLTIVMIAGLMPLASFAAGTKVTKRAADDNLVGDVDTDGEVTQKDRLILTRWLAGWSGYGIGSEAAADINGDGSVTAVDRLILGRFLSRWKGYESHFRDPDLSDDCGEDLTWALNEDGELIITGTGAMTDYASAADVPWYESRTEIKKIVVSSDATSIGDYAFSGCASLTELVLPEGILTIGKYAFADCGALKTVSFPDSLTTIKEAAFYGCGGLEEVVFGKGLTAIESGSKGAFESCGSLQSITLPDHLTTAGENSFRNSPVAVVNVPSTVTYIPTGICEIATLTAFTCEKSAFVNGQGYFDEDGILYFRDKNTSEQILVKCPSAKDPGYYKTRNKTTAIADKAFYNNQGLTKMCIFDTVTSIGANAFNGCLNLKTVFFYGDAPAYVVDAGEPDQSFNAGTPKMYYKEGTANWSSPWHGYKMGTFAA